MLKAIVRFFKALNSNSHPGDIAHAVCLGLILGFVPKSNALWYVLMIFFLFMRVNKGSLIIFTFLFSLLAPVLDPFFDTFGYWFLNIDAFVPVFSKMLDIPFVGFTKFNNSIVCGSFLSAIILYVPVYFLARLFISKWRLKIAPFVRKTKLVTFMSKLPLIVKIGEMV